MFPARKTHGYYCWRNNCYCNRNASPPKNSLRSAAFGGNRDQTDTPDEEGSIVAGAAGAVCGGAVVAAGGSATRGERQPRCLHRAAPLQKANCSSYARSLGCVHRCDPPPRRRSAPTWAAPVALSRRHPRSIRTPHPREWRCEDSPRRHLHWAVAFRRALV